MQQQQQWGQQQGQQGQQHWQRMKRVLDYELEENEQLLWSCQPDPRRVFRENSAILFIAIPWLFFVLLWLVFIVWLLVTSHQFGQPYGTLIALIDFGFPFLLLLLGLFLFDIPFRAARRARRTIYAITSKRVLIITAARKRSIQSHTFIGHVERIERRNEKGDLIFGPSQSIRFTGIPNVRSVEQLLLSLRFIP